MLRLQLLVFCCLHICNALAQLSQLLNELRLGFSHVAHVSYLDPDAPHMFAITQPSRIPGVNTHGTRLTR
jgi:hypothetical protein